MSSISKVVVAQQDPRSVAAVRLGFEREGASVVTVDAGAVAGVALDADVGLVPLDDPGDAGGDGEG